MLVGSTRASFLAAAVSAVLAGAVVPACSPAGLADAGESTSDAQPPCPASFIDVATASCSLEGQACTYLAPCATFAANATCVCTGGAFVCNGFGDAAVTCPVLTTTESCPLSETSANGLFCSDPGLMCTYKSACPDIPAFDTCECVPPINADDELHFECSMPCIPVGDATVPPAVDAGLPDAGSDVVEPPVDAPAPSPDGGGASDP